MVAMMIILSTVKAVDKALLTLKGLLKMIDGDGGDDDHSVHCEGYGLVLACFKGPLDDDRW